MVDWTEVKVGQVQGRPGPHVRDSYIDRICRYYYYFYHRHRGNTGPRDFESMTTAVDRFFFFYYFSIRVLLPPLHVRPSGPGVKAGRRRPETGFVRRSPCRIGPPTNVLASDRYNRTRWSERRIRWCRRIWNCFRSEEFSEHT